MCNDESQLIVLEAKKGIESESGEVLGESWFSVLGKFSIRVVRQSERETVPRKVRY